MNHKRSHQNRSINKFFRRKFFSIFVFVGGFAPAPDSLKFKLKPTHSRVLLVNVSESGPISEFSTKFIFLPILIKTSRTVFLWFFFSKSKKFHLLKTFIFFGKVENRFCLSQTTFFMIRPSTRIPPMHAMQTTLSFPPKVAKQFFAPKDAQCSETYAKKSDFFYNFSCNKIFILSFGTKQ